MSIQVYYSRGQNYIPSKEDFVCTFTTTDYLEMKPAFEVLKVRTGFDISPKTMVELNAPSVGALIEAIYDLVPHQKKENKILAIDNLNEIAQQARENNFGLAFYGEESKQRKL